jgi:hypothetical protein
MNKQTRRDNDGVCVLKTRALPCFNATSAYPKGGLGQVHWLARLVQGAGSPRYNLYNWSTFWVQETIDEARCVTGWPMALPGGGPARRVTGITLVGQRWRWTKQFADLDTFMARTLSSQQKTPND